MNEFERLNLERIGEKLCHIYGISVVCVCLCVYVWWDEHNQKREEEKKQTKNFPVLSEFSISIIHSNLNHCDFLYHTIPAYVCWTELLCFFSFSHYGLSIKLKWQRHFNIYNTHIFNRICVGSFDYYRCVNFYKFFLSLTLSQQKQRKEEEEEEVKILNANRLSHNKRPNFHALEKIHQTIKVISNFVLCFFLQFFNPGP